MTCGIVSLGHIRRKEELTRGFCASQLHAMFNFMTVAILFPLECATGFLAFVTNELTVGTSSPFCKSANCNKEGESLTSFHQALTQRVTNIGKDRLSTS
jgi:hypothetical protein